MSQRHAICKPEAGHEADGGAVGGVVGQQHPTGTALGQGHIHRIRRIPVAMLRPASQA